MHCAKVTGALLGNERLFKEYMVPFRRTARPPQQAEAGIEEQGKVETAELRINVTESTASKLDGRTTDGLREPILASEDGTPSVRIVTEALDLSASNGDIMAEVGGVAEAFSESTSCDADKGDGDVEAGEGRSSSGEQRLPKSRVTAVVTEQKGPRGEGELMDVLLWNRSAVAKSKGCRYVLYTRLETKMEMLTPVVETDPMFYTKFNTEFEIMLRGLL